MDSSNSREMAPKMRLKKAEKRNTVFSLEFFGKKPGAFSRAQRSRASRQNNVVDWGATANGHRRRSSAHCGAGAVAAVLPAENVKDEVKL